MTGEGGRAKEPYPVDFDPVYLFKDFQLKFIADDTEGNECPHKYSYVSKHDLILEQYPLSLSPVELDIHGIHRNDGGDLDRARFANLQRGEYCKICGKPIDIQVLPLPPLHTRDWTFYNLERFYQHLVGRKKYLTIEFQELRTWILKKAVDGNEVIRRMLTDIPLLEDEVLANTSYFHYDIESVRNYRK